jgi:hypothetical protein
MSTRATYRFEDGPKPYDYLRHGPITFYVHHDGYPAGAALYFYQMLTHERERGNGGLAEQFIRANEGAEFTRSHSAHGDTEYRYDIIGTDAGATVKCSAFVWQGDKPREADRWEIRAVDTLGAFIDKHAPEFSKWFTEGDKPYSRFRIVKLGSYHGQAWLNVHTAARRLNHPLDHLRIWKAGNVMPVWAANWQGCLENMAAILAEFPELGTEETAEFLRDLGAKCPEAATA